MSVQPSFLSRSGNHPVLFFDGVCNLCDGVVQFFIRRDRKGQFRFASLQSTAGQEAIQAARQSLGRTPDSVLLYLNGRYYVQSDAVLHALALLGGAWSLSKAGFIFPRFIRNGVYDWVARNRYRWYGKKDACMIPTPDLRTRFLDD